MSAVGPPGRMTTRHVGRQNDGADTVHHCRLSMLACEYPLFIGPGYGEG